MNLKLLLGLILSFFVFETSLAFAETAKSSTSPQRSLTPDAKLWAASCERASVEKLVGKNDFWYNREGSPELDLADEYVDYFIGPKYSENWEEIRLGEFFVKSGSDEIPGTLRCVEKKIVEYQIHYKGEANTFLKVLEGKYGKHKEKIPLYRWEGADGSSMIRGMGTKTQAGEAYVFENSANRIFLAQSRKGSFEGPELQLIFFNPELFKMIKASIDKVNTAKKAAKDKSNSEEKNKLPDL